MIQVLRHKNFALLWTGGLISMVGNWVLFAILPFYVYQLTGSALATSGTLMAYIAPGVLFGSLAGVFADRWDRRRVMLFGNLLQMGVVLILLLVRSAEGVWLIYVATFIEGSIGQFISPAENALLPTIVPEAQLVAANSLNSMNDNLARLIGPALGGVLLGYVGFESVVMIDAVTFGAAALLISLVKLPAVSRSPAAVTRSAASAWTSFWQDWIAGLRYIRQVDLLRVTFTVIAIALFGDAILSALLAVFVQDTMGLTAVDFGYMMTARGIGGLIGGVLLGQLGEKLSLPRVVSWSLLLVGPLILVMVIFPVLVVVLPLLVIAGVAAIGFLISSQTILQQASEESYRGRVFGTYGTTIMFLMLVGSALAGFLADVVGTIPLFVAAAAIYLLAALIGLVLYRRTKF